MVWRMRYYIKIFKPLYLPSWVWKYITKVKNGIYTIELEDKKKWIRLYNKLFKEGYTVYWYSQNEWEDDGL